jgi:predicted secreted protein
MSETKLPDHLDLQVNEEVSIALPGVGVSGYVWRLQQAGAPGVAETAVQRANAETSGGSVGRAAQEMLIVRAATPGKLTLHLALRRPWEHDAAPLQSHTIEVNVV